MLYTLGEYGRYVEITSYRNIQFDAAEAFLKANRKQTQKVDVQFFDTDHIATSEHLYFAALNTLAAFRGKTNISKSPAMETMLYASAQRQIQKAIARCGIKPASKNMAVLIIGEDSVLVQSALQAVTECVGKAPDETALEMTPEKIETVKKAFEITAVEVKTAQKDADEASAVVALVVERVALLATQL